MLSEQSTSAAISDRMNHPRSSMGGRGGRNQICAAQLTNSCWPYWFLVSNVRLTGDTSKEQTIVKARCASMARRSAYASPGWAGAIGITVGLYLTVGICLGGAFYLLMQPKVIENAGVAAYRPPPGTALGYAPALVRSSGPP